jgi:Cd(II)/Pb(II)-responsive transcriptional regulator
MRIQELAARAGCPPDTIRYYERVGLFPEPARGENNYRRYGNEHVERLAFIRRCRALDMSLAEIEILLAAIEHPDADCEPVNALLEEHTAHVAARIRELNKLKSELDTIRAHCAGERPTKSCGILESLKKPGRRAPGLRSHLGGVHKNGKY